MSGKSFASTGDLGPKKASFDELGEGLYAYTAEGDPNTGVIVGEDCCAVIDAQATPKMAKDVIARIRDVTDKPVKYVILSHYHAVRVFGASAYAEATIIASDATRGLIVERGEGRVKGNRLRLGEHLFVEGDRLGTAVRIRQDDRLAQVGLASDGRVGGVVDDDRGQQRAFLERQERRPHPPPLPSPDRW